MIFSNATAEWVEGMATGAFNLRRPSALHPQISPFERALCASDNQFVFCVCYLLLWLAQCDGKVSEGEKKVIADFVNSCDESVLCDEVAKFTAKISKRSIHLACEIIQKGFGAGVPPAPFVEIAIIIAIADGALKPYENHVLRFLADLAGFSKADFAATFVEITGRPFPPPGDLSSGSFWREHSTKSNNEPKQANRLRDPQRTTALAVLGLQADASLTDIRSAYRRLVHVHHPDRFAQASKRHAKEANDVFLRIKEAYDYLVGNA